MERCKKIDNEKNDDIKMGIKQQLDQFFGITEEDVDQLILEQKIEDEENKIKILKELRNYKKFEDYFKDHVYEFKGIIVNDDFASISIPSDMYPNIELDLLKKINIICENFGILVYLCEKNLDKQKYDDKREKIDS